jgi:hypothetical protein
MDGQEDRLLLAAWLTITWPPICPGESFMGCYPKRFRFIADWDSALSHRLAERRPFVEVARTEQSFASKLADCAASIVCEVNVCPI